MLVAFQSAISIGDTWFVGRLGTAPLAGLALVFPLLMLLQMTSAGAMGGGVSSAIARALGAGDAAKARRLVVHALLIALGMAAAFTLLLLAFARPLYGLLGGRGEDLRSALAYSNIVFAGAATVWLANTLASVLRGSGNMRLPAAALVASACLHVPLSGALALGLGPLPRLGIAGPAIAYVANFGLAGLAMALAVFRPASALRPHRADFALERRLFADILRVGGLSSLNSLQTVVTTTVLTGFVGRYGPAALAGYGVGVRLELLQIPLVFAVGQAHVVLVGTSIGAGDPARARTAAWAGTALAAGVCLAIGAAAAIFPLAWVGLFSSDPGVLDAGATYLRIVAPFYPLLGAGMALYFVSQGAGRMLRPVLASTTRLAIVVFGGALAASLPIIFGVVAAGILVSAALMIWFVARARW
ncbi:MAG TPA: MATE family efflux transporter [Burkholderiales bacterium]|nr:MATE family efflux transporter [Burkholderiales bacterium]